MTLRLNTLLRPLSSLAFPSRWREPLSFSPHSLAPLVLLSLAPWSNCLASDTIYVVTNKAEGNTVAAFRADNTAPLSLVAEYATGGLGTGDLEIPALEKNPQHPLANGDDPLISANALAAAADGTWLIVVNPGDGTLSLMNREKDGSLQAVNSEPASDRFPVSVAIHDELIAVASVGNSNQAGSIALYRHTPEGLAAVDGSRRDLGARPSTIGFSSSGDVVIVNELVSGKIHSFAASPDGLSAEPVATVDSPRSPQDRFQAIPVGFAVGKGDPGDLILMSEARFLTPEFGLREDPNRVPQSPLYSWQTSSVSSYVLDKHGKLTLKTGDALTGEAMEGGEIANCWVALNAGGDTLFTANALSSSISRYHVDPDGSVTLEDATAYKDDGELLFFSDMALNPAGDSLYQLVGNTGEVLAFDVAEDGSLSLRDRSGGLPTLGTYGLVVLEDG